eukprot:GFKZ01010403.1.p3 GENE.GFKZ01010403.1~~GFKZ01010403.1.p3  ORF type:complete len:106 (-),score=9.86 GFKZ01010403.1:346-663(-)
MNFCAGSNAAVPMSDAVHQQVALPLRRGGHGFNPLVPLNMSSCTANVMDAESLRPPNEPNAAPWRALHLAEADACLWEFFRRLQNSDADDYRGPPQDKTAARLAS